MQNVLQLPGARVCVSESCLDYNREGNLTLRQWLRSLRGPEEAGYFAQAFRIDSTNFGK